MPRCKSEILHEVWFFATIRKFHAEAPHDRIERKWINTKTYKTLLGAVKHVARALEKFPWLTIEMFEVRTRRREIDSDQTVEI